MPNNGRRSASSGDPNDQIVVARIDPTRTPFEEAVAYRTYGSRFDPDPGNPEDLYARAIIREQGFDGTPHVVPRTELAEYVAGGEVEAFRGLTGDAKASAEHYAEQFRYGMLFVGRGTYGGGTYASESLDDAREFADPPDGVVLRMTLKQGARIGDGEALTRGARAELQATIERLGAELLVARDAALRIANIQGDQLARSRYAQGVAIANAKFVNIGAYAAYLGHDGLYFRRDGYYLILNRTAVRVQREDLR